MYLSKEEFVNTFGDVTVKLSSINVYDERIRFTAKKFKNKSSDTSNFSGITHIDVVIDFDPDMKTIFYTDDKYKVKNLPIVRGTAYNGITVVLRFVDMD